MGWVLRLVETGVEGSSRSVDVMAIDPSGDLDDIAALGLTLAQGKQLVALVQQEIVTAQSRDHAGEHVKVWEIGGSSRRRRRIGWPLNSGNPWDEHAYRDPAPDRW